MSKFKVGDKARVLWSDYCPEMVGRVVVITGPLERLHSKDNARGWFGHRTNATANSGRPFSPRPEQLAPVADSPKREIDTVVSWGDCAWKPSQQVRADVPAWSVRPDGFGFKALSGACGVGA